MAGRKAAKRERGERYRDWQLRGGGALAEQKMAAEDTAYRQARAAGAYRKTRRSRRGSTRN